MPFKGNDPPNERQTSINPYTTLSLPSTATAAEIKTAYKKLALRHHPGKFFFVKFTLVSLHLTSSHTSHTHFFSDKVPPSERPTAHTTFQNVAFAYAVLSDERRRKRYDATGNTSESLDPDDLFDWTAFYRNQYADIVTSAGIDKLKGEYQGSMEERGDVLAYYERYKGNMNGVYEEVMMSNVLDDDERFRAIIDEAIEKGEVEAFDTYVNETDRSKKRRIAKAKREAKQAAELTKKPGIHEKLHGNGVRTEVEKSKKKKDAGEDDLASLIQQRSKARASTFLENLEMKYSNGNKKKKKQANDDEPPESAFSQTAKRKRQATSKANVKKKQSIETDEDDEETLGSEDSHSSEPESGLDSQSESEPKPEPPAKKRKRGPLPPRSTKSTKGRAKKKT